MTSIHAHLCLHRHIPILSKTPGTRAELFKDMQYKSENYYNTNYKIKGKCNDTPSTPSHAPVVRNTPMFIYIRTHQVLSTPS